MADSKQKFATIVYRAGNKQGPSFHLKDKSIEKAWLVTNPKLYYCLGQGKKQLEEVWLWEADVSNLSKDIAYCHINDEVIQVELSQWQDSINTEKTVEEIHARLKSLDWQIAAIPQCHAGFSLMKLSPMVQAVIVYMRDHYPTTPEELNFHAELKAASQWCFSDDYEQLAMKEVPVNDCRLRIAATETLKTWEKEKEDLESSKANNMYKDGDSSDESVDEQLSDVIEAIRVLNVYLSSKKKGALKPQELLISGGEKDPLEVQITTVNEEEEEEEQLERALGDPDKPVPPRVDFRLIGGKIQPELSSGLRLYSDFSRLPLHDQRNPERLWKLERLTADDDLQMYPKEIKIVLENAHNGQYLIKPTEPVRLETFKQMLRCLPWVKMYSFEELRNNFY